MKNYESIGIQVPQVYLPRPGVDLHKWAVIACDQFTSEPEYWKEVERIVGQVPSTYNLILPEVFLGQPEEDSRLISIHAAMENYLESGILIPYEGFVYVERETAVGKKRKGLVLALDLECYDYTKNSQSLIRATEGTIVDRLPPRIKIREGAPLELPHILVLIDDPQHTVIEPLSLSKNQMKPLYNFELMLDSGHLEGYLVNNPVLQGNVVRALERLADPAAFQSKYAVKNDQAVLLFAMGDGNHSLATAKAIWEKIKPKVGMQHPARYALVEIENLHDSGLEFEPIHRVLFNVQQDPVEAFCAEYAERANYRQVADLREMISQVDESTHGIQRIGVLQSDKLGILEITDAPSNLPVGTLQAFLDKFLKQGGAAKIDYVHGAEPVSKLSSEPGNAGFYLPAMQKDQLFKTVILDGALPRKTFSMGEAREKRFYVEARRITP